MKTILYSQVVFVALSARISRILLRFVWNWSAIFPKVTLLHLGVPKIKKVCKSFLTLEGWNQTPLNVICFTFKSGLEDTSLPKNGEFTPTTCTTNMFYFVGSCSFSSGTFAQLPSTWCRVATVKTFRPCRAKWSPRAVLPETAGPMSKAWRRSSLRTL